MVVKCNNCKRNLADYVIDGKRWCSICVIKEHKEIPKEISSEKSAETKPTNPKQGFCRNCALFGSQHKGNCKEPSYGTRASNIGCDRFKSKLSQETKPTNPKDALAIKKAPLSTFPTGPMYEVALAMLEGARKYGRHNYRVMGVKASVYYDATMGHITAWWEGEDIDPLSDLHHLAKAMACLAIVRDSEMMGNWVDDRPPHYPDASKLMRNHPTTAAILKKYPNCKKPFTWRDTDRTKPIDGGH